MKKNKFITPVLSIVALSSSIAPLVGCSYKNDSTRKGEIELLLDVQKQEVTLQGWNIVKQQKSWFILSLPEGKAIKDIELTIGNLTLKSGEDGISLDANKITIFKEKMVDSKVVVKTITLKEPQPEIKKVESVSINNTTTNLEVESELELTATVLPADASNKSLKWTVVDDTGSGEITTHDDKTYLKGITIGTVNVTATAQDGSGKADTKQFTITPKVTIGLDKTSAKMNKVGSLVLTATVDPSSLSSTLTWSSSDESIATVVEGPSNTATVTAVGLGDAKITATVGNKTATCDIYIRNAFAEVDWLTISEIVETFETSNQDEDAMKALCNNFSDVEYKETIDPSITDINLQIEAHLANFIGKRHSVAINTKNHTVRVVGINHDTIAGSSDRALFTFDMATILSDSSGNRISSRWDWSNNYDYTNSVLRANLNGKHDSMTTDPTWSTTAIKMFTTELQSIIKTVTKQASTTSTYTFTEYDDQLFPLTCTEMAKTSKYTKVEGTGYKYWIDNNNNPARIKSDVNGKASNYWLSSPQINGDASSWNCDYYGEIAGSHISTSYYVSFAFCI